MISRLRKTTQNVELPATPLLQRAITFFRNTRGDSSDAASAPTQPSPTVSAFLRCNCSADASCKPLETPLALIRACQKTCWHPPLCKRPYQVAFSSSLPLYFCPKYSNICLVTASVRIVSLCQPPIDLAISKRAAATFARCL